MAGTTLSLHGVFPPVPTPFDKEGEVALGALAENLERLNQYDLTGYVVLGSNGEAVYLDPEEKRAIWEAARGAIPSDKLMIAGTGCESTRQTIALTHMASRAGADAALVVTPHYYNTQMKPDSMLYHYQAVADESPIPILIYNVPKFTNVSLDAPTIARASLHPNIVGEKDTSGNLILLAETVRLARTGFQVLAGSAGFLLAGLAVGAVGGILALANVAPKQSIDIFRMFCEGRWGDAADLQRRMIPVNSAVTARHGIAGLKAAMDMLGFHGGPVRSPLLNLTDQERVALRGVLAEGGLFS